MVIKINSLTPELFLVLYSSNGWEPPCIEQVRTALEHTLATFTAYDGELPVGQVWHLFVKNGRHSWPSEKLNGIDANRLILEFFAAVSPSAPHH